MIIFISGGAKNGKTTLGQDLAVQLAASSNADLGCCGGVAGAAGADESFENCCSAVAPHYYVATMIPADSEDHERIRRHIEDREGMGFETIEVGRNILSCLETADCGGTFLLDSVTALLLNELFPDPVSCEMDIAAAEQCADDVAAFAKMVKNAVIISDYIYSDAARYDEVTEVYRSCLAAIDRKLAAAADTVIEVSAGNIFVHKGELPA